MADLFRIETDRILLTWGSARGHTPPGYSDALAPPGRLILTPVRNSLEFQSSTWRAGVPEGAAHSPDETAGPRLFEQTDYAVFIESKGEGRIRLHARDPSILRDLHPSPSGRAIHGVINFGQQVGISEFTVRVDGAPELTLQVEVFPTKLDYTSDYERLVADVQDILTGLVLEYLRATFRLGSSSAVAGPTRLEWLGLLRHVLHDLERAADHIARFPKWNLKRDPHPVHPERIKRVDAAVRRSVMRSGALSKSVIERPGRRDRVVEQRPAATLDTPEHRWLAGQLGLIRRSLARLRQEEAKREQGARTQAVLAELAEMEARIVRLSRLAPFVAATSLAPANFASVQLVSAPGYREAYRLCLVLLLGIRLSGDVVETSLKDVSELYEYWCFLTLLRATAAETGQPIPFDGLLKVEQRGLRVQLRRGNEQRVPFTATSGRRVVLSYNPQFQGDDFLLPQRPDIVITLEDQDWPSIKLVVDAKYRLDTSGRYVERYGMAGPPEDAINVLHRYRDAILELDGESSERRRPKHSVIQAAALFPSRKLDAYAESRLRQALERIGVGAIPLLPDAEDYLYAWLRATLQQGGWELSDRAISHVAPDRARRWREAAAQAVLVGTLRGDTEQEHLDWIREARTYYMRLSRTQPRQYATRHVALYLSTRLRSPGAVAYRAAVREIEVKQRRAIKTPWKSLRDGDEQQIVFHLGELSELAKPIVSHRPGDAAPRISSHRWTSRLALDRASSLEELFLETEPEWRLLEALRARGSSFRLEVERPRLQSPEDPAGRVWFVAPQGRAQYRGAAGFAVRTASGRTDHTASIERVVSQLEAPSLAAIQ